ncbi:PilZ domain-containing protein [Microvirga arabica]|uniref:PilZ domain-containing protein n=1 Tax=Microvirga arabica TaxID=1128671 RepID=UPI001939378F|nr:PilZ domain-containing protein [Microvirga arabica]MBM1172001.1 PilZ domain-containing protein [Microvirga arabica]
MNQGQPERRSSARVRTRLTGRVAGEDHVPIVDCLLWDLSATGARLVFPDPAAIPLEFDALEFSLQIPEQGASARVRLIWTTGDVYGVMFTH